MGNTGQKQSLHLLGGMQKEVISLYFPSQFLNLCALSSGPGWMCACALEPVKGVHLQGWGVLAEAGGCWRACLLVGCLCFRAVCVQQLRCSAVTALSSSGTMGICSHIRSLGCIWHRGLCSSRDVKLLACILVGCRSCSGGAEQRCLMADM